MTVTQDLMDRVAELRGELRATQELLAQDRAELERLRAELAKHGRGKCMEFDAKYGGDVHIPTEDDDGQWVFTSERTP